MGERESVAAQKARLRAQFRKIRAETPPAHLAEASRAICARLAHLVPEAGVVSAFWPLPGEVDLRPLLRGLTDAGVIVALPVTASAPGEPPRLVHRLLTDDLVPGRFGVHEPPPSALIVDPREIAVALVPGLAATREGVRLGYGGGYYDAFLPETPAQRLGVVLAAFLVETLPAETHDARLDGVVTERETVWVSNPAA